MSRQDDIIEKLFKSELRYVNKHLPVARKSLDELLREPEPCVLLRDGSRHCIRKRELKKLAELLNPEDRKRLLLPIIIQAGRGDRETRYLVENVLEASVVEMLLGQNLGASERGFVVLYPLQVAELLSSYPTLFQITIASSQEQIENASLERSSEL
ncbi:MAG: DUF61 family protein [Acidilobaceae archaeon]